LKYKNNKKKKPYTILTDKGVKILVMNIPGNEIIEAEHNFQCEICKQKIHKVEIGNSFKITHGCLKKGIFIEFTSPKYVHAKCFK